MAKVSKSVREKRKDFSKTKLKVGKSKQAPANQTDTSFRSKAIVLPKQSVTKETTSKEANTLQHHLALLTHKSGEIRRDAMQQLTTHLLANPPKSSTVVTPLMNTLTPMIIDDTTSVRRMLLELFSAVLSKLPKLVLNAHADLLLLYIASAMSHISPTIRADSTRFLSWAMSYTNATEIIVSKQLDKFINTFSTLLGWNSQSSNISNSRALATHLEAFNQCITAAITETPEVEEPAIEYLVPLKAEQPCFVPHSASRRFLESPQALNLFSSSDPLQQNADGSNFTKIEPHVEAIFKYMSNKFTDSANADRTLCLPILGILQTFIQLDEIKSRKDLRATMTAISRNMDNLQEQTAQGSIAGLVGQWRNIKEELMV